MIYYINLLLRSGEESKQKKRDGALKLEKLNAKYKT